MTRLILFLGFQALYASAHAAAPPQSLAPFFDDEAIAVVRLDLSKVDIPKTTARLIGPLDTPSRTPSGVLAGQILAAQAWVNEIRKAGAAELFLIAGMGNFPSPPSVAVPLEAGADAKRIGEILCGGGGEKSLYAWPTCAVVHDAVFAGTREALERVRRNDPKVPLRAGLAQALGGEIRGELQVALAPTDDQRRILEEMIPILPKELGGGPISVLTRGMKWGVIGVELEPKAAIHLSIQASDPAAADSLRKLATDALRYAGQAIGQNPGVAKVLDQVDFKVAGDRLTSDLDLDQFATLLRPPLGAMKEAAARSQCVNNLKWIMLAMHNYHDVNQSFPPAFKADKAGKPLLSWRVLILPYLDQNGLYREFHLDEPWDSPHNNALISRMPDVYRCPSTTDKNSREHRTTYLVPRGKATVFPGATGLKLKEITDGTSNTIAVVDAGEDRAVIWTAPEDWEIDGGIKPETVLNHHPTGSTTGFADGSARFIKSNIKPDLLGKLMTPAGGEVIGPEDY